jgi:hypothetical protein
LCNVPYYIVMEVVGEVFRKFKSASHDVSYQRLFLCPMLLYMHVTSIDLTSSIMYRTYGTCQSVVICPLFLFLQLTMIASEVDDMRV